MITEDDLKGLPWAARHLIMKTLANEKCTPDHVLVLAEALDEYAAEFPSVTFYVVAYEFAAANLRDVAASFSRAPIEAV